jgi:hypothetical protein
VQWLRPWRVCAALLLAVLASIGVAPPASADAPASTRLLVVAVPGLLWDDVREMPHLREFVDGAAVADLSVKSLASVTRCGDGLLTLSAGSRVGHATAPCDVDIFTEEEARELNADGPFEARLGAFGQALQDAGLRTAAVGGPAQLMLANAVGGVDLRTVDESAAFAGGDVVGVVLPELYDALDPDRDEAAAAVDAQLGRLLATRPADVVAVVGVSDGDAGRTHLHAFAVRGPGLTSGSLTTVQRPPYLQLVDVAPTLLDALDISVPDDMDGAVADRSSHRPSLDALVDADRHATTAARLGSATRLVLWLGTLLLALLWVGAAFRPALARTAVVVAWPLAFAPMLTYLVQAVPWWRGGKAAFVALVAGGAVLLGAVAAAVSRRLTDPRTAAVLPAACTVAVLVVDQLLGAPLQFSAPMGDNPLVAGRFRGMGNTDFALVTTSVVLLAGLLGARLVTTGRRRTGVLVTAGLAVLVLAVDGLPVLGDDFGGMLAFLPVAAGLVAAVGGVRLTAWRVLTAALALAVVVVVIAVGDYLRPTDAQTHIGRFVGDVLDGDAGGVIARKARASARSLTNVPALLAVAGAVAGVLTNRRRLFPAGRSPVLLPGAVVLLGVLAFLGSALNDSGIVVAAFVAVTAVPPMVIASRRPATVGDGGRRQR